MFDVLFKDTKSVSSLDFMDIENNDEADRVTIAVSIDISNMCNETCHIKE